MVRALIDLSRRYSITNLLPGDEYMQETANTLLLGEDPKEDLGDDEVRLRLLNNFVLFNSASQEYVTLADLPGPEGSIRNSSFRAVGECEPVFEEEEEGQEDSILAESREPQLLRTSGIQFFTVDYGAGNG